MDTSAFTPGASLLGGVLLGVATAALLLLNGRVLGVCGVVAGLLRPVRGDTAWRVALVLGLLTAPFLAHAIGLQAPARVDASWATTLGAGLIVGVGTRYANGCTSGHGICGLARLSPRSLVATLSFMAAGFATVFVTRHLLPLA